MTTTEDAVAKAIARDPDLLMKTVDLLLANSDAAPKDASAHPVGDAATSRAVPGLVELVHARRTK